MPKIDPHTQAVHNLPPTILTIFGATGDLSADYLVPALLHMSEHNMLPKNFKLVCVGRRPLDTKGYLNFIVKKSHIIKKLTPKKKGQVFKTFNLPSRGF